MRNRSGQSLVGVMVSIAVMGIVMVAMARLFTTFNHETQALAEKLATLDLEKAAIGALADGTVCMQLTSGVTFDATQNPMPSTPITVVSPSALYASYVSGVWGPVIAQAGSPASAYGNLLVNSIRLQLTGKAGTTFKGNWVIDFSNSIRSLKPIMISTTLTVSAASSTATVASCQGSGSGSGSGGGNGTWCGAFLGDSSGNVTQMTMPCHGQAPGCTVFGVTGNCLGNLTGICPTGYTLQPIMSVLTSFTGGSGGGAGGIIGSTSSSASGSVLYTCSN